MKKRMLLPLQTLVTALLVGCSGAPLPSESDAVTSAAPPADPPPDSAPPAGTTSPVGPGKLPSQPGLPAGSPWLFAARKAAGGVALVDIASGDVLAEAAGGGLGGEADLACDPWLSRVLVFEADADGEWGEIASHPIEGDPAGDGLPVALGPRDHEVWVDGVARVAASPSGALVFEDGAAGPRWKVVSEQSLTPSTYGPRPAALETGVGPGGLFHVEALTYGPENDALDVRSASVDMGGIHVDSVLPLGLSPPAGWPSVRWARTAAGPHLLSAAGGDVLLSVPAPGGAQPWSNLPVGPFVERIEGAVALPGGHTLVALASGEADVVVIKLGPDGGPACTATADLPGEVEPALLFFSRSLLAVGPGRALAATSSGVLLLDVTAGCPFAIEVDPAFPGEELRAPLDACPIVD